MLDSEPQEVVDLAGRDDDRDAGGKAGDHRVRNVADDPPGAGISSDDQYDPRHDGRDDKAVIAVRRDDIEDDNDEGAGRAADLGARTPEQGDEKARDDGGEKPLVG